MTPKEIEKLPLCEGCNQPIDIETCHCGDPVDQHGLWCGHSPVYMGCICHTLNQEDPE